MQHNHHTVKQLTTLCHPATEDPAFPPEMAALWGAFLHEGLMDSLSSKRNKAILGKWKMGCIELMTETCVYLPLVWDEVYRQWDSSESYCGIFEYEVLSILGHYLGDHIILKKGQLPPPEEVKDMIQTLVYSFLENSSIPQQAG